MQTQRTVVKNRRSINQIFKFIAHVKITHLVVYKRDKRYCTSYSSILLIFPFRFISREGNFRKLKFKPK